MLRATVMTWGGFGFDCENQKTLKIQMAKLVNIVLWLKKEGLSLEELKRVVNKKQVVNTLFWVVILFGAVGGYLVYRNEVKEAFGYLQDANLAVLLMLVPIIFAMYWAAGQIWYPYLRHDGLSASQLASIQYELNFVNTVVPFLSISGWVYAVTRLKKLNVSAGRISGMYIFRYIISISTKWLEIAAIMYALAFINASEEAPVFFAGFAEMPTLLGGFIIVLAVVIVLGFILGFVCFLRRLRIPTRLLNNSSSWSERMQRLQETLDDLYQTLELAFCQRTAFLSAFIWGLAYSALEAMPFAVVAIAMGHPELAMPAVVASGVAITVGVIIPTPMGIGGFDGAMILCLGAMGTSVALASAIVLTTRIIVLVGTTVTGIPFWRHGMEEIARD